MNPFPRKITLAALAWLCLWSASVVASGAEQRTYGAGSFRLSIDGIAYNNVRSWRGAETIADIAVESATAGATPKKHVASIHYAPLTLEFNFEDSPAFIALINELLSNKTSPHVVNITELDFNRAPRGPALEAVNATLVEVDFSRFEGSAKDPARFTLVFQPGQVRAGTPIAGNSPPKGSAKAALSSNYSFVLDALPCNRIATVSAFTAKRGAKSDNVEFSNLILTISNADFAAWKAWENSFLTQGQNSDAEEKSATFTILGPDMKTALQTMQFSHVGLVRLSEEDSASGNERISRFEAELYYESAAIVAPGDTPADKGGSTPPPPPPASTPATTTPAPAADKPADSTAAPSTTAPASNEPSATPATTPGEASAGKDSSAGDPADRAVRDPRGFLRIEGLVRKTYESGDWESSSEETATYVAKQSIDEVLQKYEEALKKAGWEELRKYESGSAADFSRNYHLQCVKTVVNADLRLSQTKTGGTDITVQIDTKRVGILSSLAAALKGMAAEASAAEGSPNDQGARDPADFPRIARSVRKSYVSSGTAKAPDENAVYRAKATMVQAEAFFVNQLTKDDWEQSVRREKGDPISGTHEISLNWSKGRRAVRIFLKEIEPGITEINAQLSTSPAP